MENWHGGFKSNGTVNIQDITLPVLTIQRKLDMQFSLLPERTNHACYFIISMKYLRRLGISIDLQTNTAKCDGVPASMVNKGN